MITRRTALVSCAAAAAAATIPERAGAQSGRTRMSANSPYVIANPVLGLVNLAGPAGNALLERDRAVLADVFGSNIRIAENEVPVCNVLFFYGTLEPSTRVAGQ